MARSRYDDNFDTITFSLSGEGKELFFSRACVIALCLGYPLKKAKDKKIVLFTL